MSAPICTKVSYFSAKDAKHALAAARRDAELLAALGRTHSAARRAEQRSYRCEHCRMWHLTSMSEEDYQIDQAWKQLAADRPNSSRPRRQEVTA